MDKITIATTEDLRKYLVTDETGTHWLPGTYALPTAAVLTRVGGNFVVLLAPWTDDDAEWHGSASLPLYDKRKAAPAAPRSDVTPCLFLAGEHRS